MGRDQSNRDGDGDGTDVVGRGGDGDRYCVDALGWGQILRGLEMHR